MQFICKAYTCRISDHQLSVRRAMEGVIPILTSSLALPSTSGPSFSRFNTLVSVPYAAISFPHLNLKGFRRYQILMNVGLVLASLVDISITVLLTYLLNKHKSKSDFQRCAFYGMHCAIDLIMAL